MASKKVDKERWGGQEILSLSTNKCVAQGSVKGAENSKQQNSLTVGEVEVVRINILEKAMIDCAFHICKQDRSVPRITFSKHVTV